MTLNPDQFSQRTPGVYKGEPGEPNPDEYNRDDDWRQDHRRFVARKNEGKAYVDPALQQMKRDARQRSEVEDAPEREAHQQREAKVQGVLQGLRGLNKAAGRMGMKKRRKIW